VKRTGGWKKKIQKQGGKYRGERLVEWIEENEWEVLNGNKEGYDIGSRGE
jgi:hypothetical protein